MSGSSVGAVIGAAVGFFIGGPAGAKWGWMIGSTAGAILFPPKGPDGPRLSDLNVQTASYGAEVARVWGTVRVPAVVICSSKYIEHEHEQGKGGPSYSTYSYTATFAAQFCESGKAEGVAGVRRMWANGKLKYDITTGNTGPVADGPGWSGRLMTDFYNNNFTIGFSFYPGSETQTPDPALEALKGSSPAYLGYAYAVFEDLELEKYFNTLPKIDAEIVANGTYVQPPPLAIGTGNYGAMQPGTPYFWATVVDTGGQTQVYVNDIHTQQVVKTIVIPMESGGFLDYVPAGDEIWVARSGAGIIEEDATVLSAAAMVASRVVEFSDAATIQSGLVRYSQARQEVFFASTNGASNGMHLLKTDGQVMASFTPGFWAAEALDLPEIRCISAVGDTQLAGDKQRIVLIDAIERAIVYVFDAPTYFASGGRQSCHAWDSSRSRIMWTHETQLGHFYLLDINSGITGGPVQTFFPVALGQPVNALLYHKQLDRFIAHGTSTTYIIHPETWEIEGAFNQGQGVNALYEVDGVFDYVLATFNNTVYRYYLSPRLTSLPVPVADIITDLTEEVGRTAADIDVTDLAGVLADGVVRTRRGAAQTTLEQVLMAYQIDVVESGRKVKYVRRTARTPVVIDPEEMGLHDVGQDAPTRLILTRADEVDLPRSVTIKYLNRDADYQLGAQTARRQTTLSKNELTFELSVVLTDAHALAVAEAVLYAMWAARTKAKWNMSLRYAELEPTDLVSIDGNRIRIVKATRRGNMIDCEGEFDSGVVLAGGSAPGVANPVAQTIPLRSATAIELMDIPLLRDQDNDAGFYLAASGYPGMDWPGCVFFKSQDGGASWDELLTLTTAATMGATASVLGDFSRNVFDEFNSFTVVLRSGTLSSISREAALAGGNAFLVGSELLHARSCVLIAERTYLCSGLLRGRKGTPTGGHTIGERVVLLNTSTVRRVDMATAEIGLERLYKAVTIGDSLASARSIAFSNTAVGLECLSPVKLGGGRDASGNLTIKWVRRTRIGGEWRNYVDAGLGEASEAYEVEIWNSSFTTLKRTINGLSSPTTSYSAANQTTDFGGTQSTVYVRVYQLSAAVGRGFALQGAI